MQEFIEQKARPEVFRLKPYTPGKPIEEVKRELGLTDIIKLASNENALGPSAKAVQAVQNELQQLHLYPDSYCYLLREKLANFLQCHEDQLIIGNGSDELLTLISETFVSPNDEIISCPPTFAEYEFAATVPGGNTKNVPLKADFSVDFEAVLAAINPRTKIIYLCNPNNPTGTATSVAILDDFMNRVPAGVLVVFDEAYYEFADAPDYVSGLKYLDSGKPVVILRTFSKIYGLAALRVGYGVTLPEIAHAVAKVREPFNVNMLAQVGAAAALADTEHVKRSLEVNRQGKEYLYAAFNQLGLSYVPSQANFIFLDTGKDSQEVFGGLLKLGVIVRTGDIFGFPTFIRVTIGTKVENERFVQSLTQVLAH